MADTFVKNPVLLVGGKDKVVAQIGENDFGVATDVEFYTKKQIDELLENSGGASLPILMQIWSDHILNNISWLRADTFSWQSGDIYTAAYNHLADDIDGKTLQSETIGSTTIQFYLADDGHKICPDTEENSVSAIYNATGVAWYYIIDTENKQFKLPREDKDGKYLYFYVGNFTQEAIEQTAGLNAELFNGKADIATVNGIDSRVDALEGYDYVVESQEPTSSNGYTWYRKYKSGWVEQGGHYTHNNVQGTVTTTLAITMADNKYNLQITKELGTDAHSTAYYEYMSTYIANSKTITSFQVEMTTANRLNGYDWQVSGMSA